MILQMINVPTIVTANQGGYVWLESVSTHLARCSSRAWSSVDSRLFQSLQGSLQFFLGRKHINLRRASLVTSQPIFNHIFLTDKSPLLMRGLLEDAGR